MFFATDFFFILQWWSVFFVIGIIFLPITTYFLGNFFDKGYIFSKILGIAIISYLIFLLGILHLVPFTTSNSIIILALVATGTLTFYLFRFDLSSLRKKITAFLTKYVFIFLFEELLFLITLTFLAWIRGFQPDIHGLEKFMDFGFINSILRSDYFPPRDMWLTPLPINYYYFGHLVTAVLTKLSFLRPEITYNLMLATIFAFTFTASFSIGVNLICLLDKKQRVTAKIFIGGFLTALLVSLSGNLHSIYSFFKPYQNDNPVPFWELQFSPSTFPNAYWYPNATRFIHNTIHEFPLYSSVVSDLHGHVLDIPFVLLTIAILFSILSHQKITFKPLKILLISFLLAIMYMTNAWDGLIYFLLFVLIIGYKTFKSRLSFITSLLFVIAGFFLFTFPFNSNFSPFVSGIGVVCAPDFLTNIGKLGPLLFEKDHCLRSPFWQLSILYGFFYFTVIVFLFSLFRKSIANIKLALSDIFIFILILLSTLLIIIPEFLYAKDIYPAHYRANTMFKLVYQAFIMLSLCCGYIIAKTMSKFTIKSIKIVTITCIWITGLFLLFLYPYFAINSYYGNLQTNHGLDGLSYLKTLYPTDYEAIIWLQKNVKGQPVILEAQGDSYTDYGRVSSNTGLPTVLGWTVHEWLWRGSYDIPSPRIEEVKTLYESNDDAKTEKLLKKYNISLVFIGKLEREKYPNLNEDKFKALSKPLYENQQTIIYNVRR